MNRKGYRFQLIRDAFRYSISVKGIALALALQASCGSGHSMKESAYFLSPGATFSSHGLGLEISAGLVKNKDYNLYMAGLLFQYEAESEIKNFGFEIGYYIVQLEFGASFAGEKQGLFLTPNLCLTMPLMFLGEHNWVAINLFVRTYHGIEAEEAFGMSLKFPLLIDPSE